MTTTTTTPLANVPHPAGATQVDDWADLHHGPEHAARYFTGSSWCVARDRADGDVSVRIDGTQSPDGRVGRLIRVDEGNYERLNELTSTDARELGRALLAAADEVEKMNGYDKVVVAR